MCYMIQVTNKWIHYYDQFVNDISSKAEASSNKKVGNNKDFFFPMPLSYTPQMKVSKEQKYTKPNNCVWKLTPAIPEDVISNAQQCETVKRFWVCPLWRGPSVAKYSSCRKCVKGSCAFSVTARGAGSQSPSSGTTGCVGGRGERGRLRNVSTFMPPWHQHTESPLDLFHTLLIMLLELFGWFFKVMEIMLGNRARISRDRVAERAIALLASPSSCSGLPCCSLGYVP